VGQIPLGETALHSLGRINFNPQTLDFLHRTPLITPNSGVDATEAFPWQITGLTYLAAFLSQIVFYLIPVQLPFYLKQLVNATASQSGLAIALATLFSAASAISYKQIKARLSFIGIYAIAFLLMSIGYLVISFSPAYAMVLVGLAIAGTGLGC
jgi:hypothetical protein